MKADSAGGLPRLGIVPYIVAGCMFMENLDATVIVTALPAMARSFAATPTTLSLGITAYMVAVAVFLPLSSWIADRIGTRTLMAAAILAFSATSLLCGLSTSLAGFVATRVLQGAAAALMSPSGRMVVLRDTPKVHLVHAVAVLTWPSLIAPVLGPPVGGFLTSYASWRWIFFLNVPLGAIGLVLALRHIPQRRSTERRPLDLAGLALTGGALGALIVGLELLGGWHGLAIRGALLVLAGLVLAALAVRHLLRAAAPLVSLASARVPSFAISALTGGTLTRVAVGATPFLLPLLFQSVLGDSAFRAGAITLVYFAGNLGMKTVTTPLLRRFGFRAILLVNGALLAAAVAACAALGSGLSLSPTLAILLVGGATRSLQFTALNTLAFADVPPAEVGAANILNSLVQQVAMTFGVSIAALALHLGGAGGAAVLTAADFARAFLVVAAFGGAGLIFYARLAVGAGDEVSGKTVRSKRATSQSQASNGATSAEMSTQRPSTPNHIALSCAHDTNGQRQ